MSERGSNTDNTGSAEGRKEIGQSLHSTQVCSALLPDSETSVLSRIIAEGLKTEIKASTADNGKYRKIMYKVKRKRNRKTVGTKATTWECEAEEPP